MEGEEQKRARHNDGPIRVRGAQNAVKYQLVRGLRQRSHIVPGARETAATECYRGQGLGEERFHLRISSFPYDAFFRNRHHADDGCAAQDHEKWRRDPARNRPRLTCTNVKRAEVATTRPNRVMLVA